LLLTSRLAVGNGRGRARDALPSPIPCETDKERESSSGVLEGAGGTQAATGGNMRGRVGHPRRHPVLPKWQGRGGAGAGRSMCGA